MSKCQMCRRVDYLSIEGFCNECVVEFVTDWEFDAEAARYAIVFDDWN